MKKFLLYFLGIFCVLSYGQQDTIVLKDLVVTDIRLARNKTQHIQKLNDSVIQKNAPLLTELLNFNTPIFFKENGYGMVSSPSFRGTTASQTSVLWNGIKINSGFLGQADFNTISSLGYDQIDIKSGGGSVAHGSGAIGGSIHLRHDLKFNKGFRANAMLGYGSYNTLKMNGNVQYSNDKLSYHINYNRNSSDNDFKVKKLNYENHNGQFYNNTLNANVGYKINSNNKLSLFLEGYQDERHFSLIEPTANKTKYRNRDLRSLIQFENNTSILNSVVRVSFLNENWKYYQNINGDPFSQGELSSLITKYDGDLKVDNSKNLILTGEFRTDNAMGSGGGINQIHQNSGNIGLSFSHNILDVFYYELGGRKEFNSKFESPFLFSVGTSFTPVKWYNLKLNASKNFRAPTFNDLYWQPGGNLDLKAEKSLQFEVSNNIEFENVKLGVNLYENKIKDMIRWTPSENGFWQPVNIDEVNARGLEVFTELKKKIKQHNFQLNSSYAYTSSKNNLTNKDLIYVPKHKWNGTLTYGFKSLFASIQGLMVSDVFIQTDNAKDLEGYGLMNMSVGIRKDKWSLIIKCNNITNKLYKAYQNRLMPTRNYGITVNINI